MCQGKLEWQTIGCEIVWMTDLIDIHTEEFSEMPGQMGLGKT